jgi:hypothetical protein
MSHSSCRRRIWVDYWLLVVGSQTASLNPDPSFAHNLSCKCLNGSCEAILDMYTSRPFHWYKEYPNPRCFDPCNRSLSFRESRRTTTSHFWECEFHPHTYPKMGLRHNWCRLRPWTWWRPHSTSLIVCMSQFELFWNVVHIEQSVQVSKFCKNPLQNLRMECQSTF